MNRNLIRKKDRAKFAVTFDEFNVVDTITVNGKPVASNHRDARPILANADRIAAGFAPRGFLLVFDRGAA